MAKKKQFPTRILWVNDEKMEAAIDIAGCTITFRLIGEKVQDVAYEPHKPSKGYIQAAKAHATLVLFHHRNQISKRSA